MASPLTLGASMFRALLMAIMVFFACALNAQPNVQLPPSNRAIADALGRQDTKIIGNNLVIDSKSRILGIAQPDGKGSAAVTPFPSNKVPQITCFRDGTCVGGSTPAVPITDWIKQGNISKFNFSETRKDEDKPKPKPAPVCKTTCEYVACESWHDKGKMCPRNCTRTCTDG